jgi:phosphatidate cytidylyltransferase
MRELLIRTVSGAVLVAVIVASILYSPWTCAALGVLIVVVGTFEMSKLQNVESLPHFLAVLVLSLGSFAVAALVALEILPTRWLFLELLFLLMPLLLGLFSSSFDYKRIAAFAYSSMAFLSMPTALMLFMYQQRLFGELAGAKLILLVFALLWTNDTFAYLTGRLLGKHKLFVRVSPGKTVEGSLGGLLFTVGGVMLFSHFTPWLPMKVAIIMGVIAVFFGTFGDLCESMLKRQARVKDSGRLIPGHGGILDRFDSVLFAIPFVFVILLLL